jgi:predicted neutral ceramidase superfamily lipid hydrolase
VNQCIDKQETGVNVMKEAFLLEHSITDTEIAIVSAIAAVISVLFAFRSNRIANKALKLSEKQYSDSQSNFSLYYNQGARYLVKDDQILKSILLFHITIRNNSSFRNTFEAGLEIEYWREDDTFAKLIVEHNPQLNDFLKESNMTIFPVNIELEAKSSSTKWLIFEQPGLLDNTHRIENYRIRITDMDANQLVIGAALLKNFH